MGESSGESFLNTKAPTLCTKVWIPKLGVRMGVAESVASGCKLVHRRYQRSLRVRDVGEVGK